MPRMNVERVVSRSGMNVPVVVMNLLDLTKATVLCAGIAFLIYSFPVLAQGMLIGMLSLLWLAYAHKAVAGLLRK